MGCSNQWGVSKPSFFLDTRIARIGRLIIGLCDSTALSVDEQLTVIGISLLFYCQVKEDVLLWLESEETMRSQVKRVTDVRLTEAIPVRNRYRGAVSCRRCGIRLLSVPCIECLMEGGVTKTIRSNYPAEASTVGWKIPPKPTDAYPGTEGKIKVMAERVRKGFDAHHPFDFSILDYPQSPLFFGLDYDA